MTSKYSGQFSGNLSDAPGEILIALGANIAGPAGPPLAVLKAALAALEKSGVAVLRVSAFYETRAWPNPADPPFINAVAVIQTALEPSVLLAQLHALETSFGRKRSAPNAPRTLDLDLLDYRGRVETGALALPHPRLAERRFVLEPQADVSPQWRHPVSGQTVGSLLAAAR
jgi:2-amino-4-hydroxy-6-hydroxymethyldihydropteridine diphosphokinase